MKTKCVFIILITFYLISFTESFGQVFKKLTKAYTDKIISADEMILNKVYYMFDPSKVNKNYIDNVSEKMKCGTPIIREYKNLKRSLNTSTQAIIEGYLKITDATSDYISSGGHFKLSYTTTGVNAVPSEDENANGVPDYVEWISSYLETAWTVEITQCGFRCPVDTKGDGYYNISFASMSGYGITPDSDVDGNEGSRIILHNNYKGFPANQDLEGTQKGAAKVSCAHEFRHASQYLYSPEMSEGEFVELDATWAEELVFDYVNDSMLHYTVEDCGDPFSMPNLSLDCLPPSGFHFYGKYFWEDFLHQKFDHNSYTSAPIILAFWQSRASNQSENVLNTYDYVLRQFGSSLSEAFTEYTVWNYYTGSRAIPGFGYDEAGIFGFPEAVLKTTQNSYPVSGSGSLDHLACEYIRLNPGSKSAVKTTFNGYDDCPMNAVVTWTNGSTVTWEKIPLNSYNEGYLVTATKNFGALIPVITFTSGIVYDYTYTITPAAFSITFTNKSGTTNLGGSFVLDGNLNDIIYSGSSRSFIEYSNHNVRTNNERFTSSNNKHHDWNGTPSEYKLPHDFQAQQGQNQNALFQYMNAVTVRNYAESSIEVGGIINFHDPWYVDQNGNQPNNILPFSSPYYPKGKYGESNGGVFLLQGYPNWTPPYYTVRAPQTVNFGGPIGVRNVYLQNWSASPANSASFQNANASETPVVFNNSGATVSANVKCSMLSSNASTFSNNSQRKLVRTSYDGWLHQVYESMGRAWLEHSTDNGSTWTLGNNGQPLDNGSGKCPSMDWGYYHYYSSITNAWVDELILAIVFQQKNGNNSTLQYAVFNKSNGTYVNVPVDHSTLYTESTDLYSVNANPNISVGGQSTGEYDFVISFERKSGAAGIYWMYGKISCAGIYPYYNEYSTPVKITGTDVSSNNATVSLNKSLMVGRGNFIYFDIVYQQGISSIKDVTLCATFNDHNNWSSSQPSNPIVISTGSAAMYNYKPSMVEMPNGDCRVCWIRDLYGMGSVTPQYVNVVYLSSLWASAVNIYGNMANSVSINIINDSSKTRFAYAQKTNNSTWQNFASNGSSIISLNTTGENIQLSNGSSSGGMYASSFKSLALPYYFQTSNPLGSLQKSSSNQITYGRGAVLTKGDAQFSYSLKSLTVDNTNIKFTDIPENKADTSKTFRHLTEKDMYYPNLDSLNAVLLSEPFTIKSNSSISLSEQAGFIDSLVAIKALGSNGYVAYTLELVDNTTNKTIAAIKSSKITVANVSLCNLSASNVNASKVGTKTVRMRITLSTNITDMQGSLVNEYGTIDDNTLARMAKDDITLQSPEVITEYALEQNYPNPFNPSTTIHYQLPNSGHVTLKVYDMLGREVATMVDEMKETGSYSATFDGARLASGVYIMRLTAQSEEGKSIVQTKKMLMLK
jgi:hypothetical protein